MKISILKLIPKDWTIREVSNYLEVSYKTKRGNKNLQPKPVKFSKHIEIDKNLVEGLALYSGDGSFQENKMHASFVSKDKDIMQFEWLFFKNRFGLSHKDVSCKLSYRKYNPKIITDWSELLDIPEHRFRVKYSIRHRQEAMQLQINRSVFRRVFESIKNEVLNSNFLENKELRRGFLRGLFAAEGHIGLAKDSPKPYINYMSYHLSIYEDKLAKCITSALSLEGIRNKMIKRESDHSIEIRIIGWDNYWKLWRARTFDICERKKAKFLTVAKNLEVNCALEKNFRVKLFAQTNLTQKELAKHLDSWQGNVCKMISGEIGISIDRLLKLSELSNIKLGKIKENILETMVGRLTQIQNDDFTDFIFNLKTNPTNPYF
jgi:hypothetical protein